MPDPEARPLEGLLERWRAEGRLVGEHVASGEHAPKGDGPLGDAILTGIRERLTNGRAR